MQNVLSVLEKFGNLFRAIHRKQIVQGPTECVDEFLWDVRVGYGLGGLEPIIELGKIALKLKKGGARKCIEEEAKESGKESIWNI